MATSIHRLADRGDLARLVAQGESFRSIAKHCRCSTVTVRKVARRHGLKSLHRAYRRNIDADGRLQEAPDEAEETLSVSSLALAPSVAELAIIVRENALAAYAAEVRSPYARKP